MPRDQRQYLGNWTTEITADIYTREKRKVVQRAWTEVADKLGKLDLPGAKLFPIDLHISIGIRRSWTWPHHPCGRAQRNRGHLHLNPDARHWRRGGQPLRAERRQLEHMHLVFGTNLLMAILSFPSMLKLNT